MPTIRTYRDTDRAELRTLFARAGEDSPTESLWGHTESEAAIYLYPYLELLPDFVFLAEAGGALVGYLTGCPDSAAFPSEATRMNDAIRRYRLMAKRGPAAFFARGLADLLVAKLRRHPTAGDFADPRWPAHLHLNVATEARGTGAADRLMRAWLDQLGPTGCHLQTLRENVRATKFFERMGFVVHGTTPLVPGLRYEGRRVHQLTMVRG